ncbi:hypothetical protein BW716_30055 [[Flexibacter] sp. ATCC 35208]|nr:hypothetical protein BW716_30055 [[Flexibacter] sp. ATCC 35208]
MSIIFSFQFLPMCNTEFTEPSENTESLNISDPEILNILKIFARILLSVNHSKPIETPVVDLNPTPEKLAA